ncbi:MAG TPA: 2-dehydropantoate 2-reductase [Luteitalea sp.]|nr:2-dehydropantoate 2-reductase [Luteitalea sp.]
MSVRSFAVVGAGAVGGYYAARLARAGFDVSLLARGAHLEAIRSRGLWVWSPLGDLVVHPRATADAAEIGHVDVVLYAVKTYDNATALPLLTPLVGPPTLVLTLQNGVSSADDVGAVVGRERVLAGPTYIATALKAPGLIEQTGMHRRIVFGEVIEPAAEPSARVLALADALLRADIQAEPVADARVPLWEKFVYLAPFAAVTGAARQPAGVVWSTPALRTTLEAAFAETEAVARAEGIAVAADVGDRIRSYMDALPASTRSSLLIDLQAGKRIELDALAADVARRGERLGVATPVMSTLAATLTPYTNGTGR